MLHVAVFLERRRRANSHVSWLRPDRAQGAGARHRRPCDAVDRYHIPDPTICEPRLVDKIEEAAHVRRVVRHRSLGDSPLWPLRIAAVLVDAHDVIAGVELKDLSTVTRTRRRRHGSNRATHTRQSVSGLTSKLASSKHKAARKRRKA